jgi:hypothetical protein
VVHLTVEVSAQGLDTHFRSRDLLFMHVLMNMRGAKHTRKRIAEERYLFNEGTRQLDSSERRSCAVSTFRKRSNLVPCALDVGIGRA